MSEFVDLHECVRHGDQVVIVADVLETHRGKSVRLVAHSPKCKKVKNV